MIGIGRIRGSALASNITLTATLTAAEQVTLTWTSSSVTTVKLYYGNGTLIYSGGFASVPQAVVQNYGTTASYYIVGSNAFGSSNTSYASVTVGPAPTPVFTSVTYSRVGWHPTLGENWQISWNITSSVSLLKLTRSGTVVSTAAQSLKYVPYKYTGSAQTFTVPSGVTSIGVDTYGAQGGNAAPLPGLNAGLNGLGGNGAYAGSTLSVTPGQAVTLTVGGAGTGNFVAPDYTPTQWDYEGYQPPGSYIEFALAVPYNGSTADFAYNRWHWNGTWSQASGTYSNVYTGSNFYIMQTGRYGNNAFNSQDANVYRMHPGGFNGGGKAYGYMTSSGGGATDVRTGGTALGNRVIVAGGGGGGAISQTWGLTNVNPVLSSSPSTINNHPMTGGSGGLTGGDATPVSASYRIYPRCSGKGATQSAGGASPAPRVGGVTFSSAVGSLGQGANSQQFMAIANNFTYANNPDTSLTNIGAPTFSGPIGVLSFGGTAPYGSGGGGGLYGGGAGVFSPDSWSYGNYDGQGVVTNIVTVPAYYETTYPPPYLETSTYFVFGAENYQGYSGYDAEGRTTFTYWVYPAPIVTYVAGYTYISGTTGIRWEYNDLNYAAPQGGGVCGYGIGAGGGGSSTGSSVSGNIRAANGLAVVGYTDPAVAASTSSTGTMYVVVPWGNSIEYVLRATGAVNSADYAFTITAGAQSALDN